MKVKRRLLAFFFSVLMIWQGFFFAKAEGEDSGMVAMTEGLDISVEKKLYDNPDYNMDIEANDDVERLVEDQNFSIVSEETGGEMEEENISKAVREDHAILKEEPAFFSKDLVNGKIQKVKDTDGMDHYLLEYVIRFNAKKYSGELEDYNAFDVHDIINTGTDSELHKLKFFDPEVLNSGFSLENLKKYKPSYRRGIWRSGRYKKDPSGKEFFEAAEDDTEHPGPFYELLDNAEKLDPDNQILADSNLWYNTWNDDATEFRNTYYNFTSQGGFELRYFVEIDEIPAKGYTYSNKVTLTDVNTNSKLEEVNSTYAVTERSGSFENDGVNIVVKKTDKDGNPLEGATFLLSRKNSSFEMEVTSNKEGIAVFSKLLPRDYEVLELYSPEGYFFDKEVVYEVKKDRFNESSTVQLNIANDRLDSDYRDIIVEKRWLLEPHCPPSGDIMPPPPKTFRPRSSSQYDAFSEVDNGGMNSFAGNEDVEENPEVNSEENVKETIAENPDAISGNNEVKTGANSDKIVADAVDSEVPEDLSEEMWKSQVGEPFKEVTIVLCANGKEVKRATLSPNSDQKKNYRHIFEKLPRNDEKGNEIVYTIKEESEEDSGYDSVISGTADTKFTITNYHKNADLVPISVTKIWEGKGPHPSRLTVYLYENGEAISKYSLSARNDWQHIFLIPADKLKDTSIRYEVREAFVKGYESARTSSEDGRSFVFKNKKKPTPPTPNNGENPPDNPRGGNPPESPGGGGGRPPRGVETPPVNGVTPPPVIPDNPGEVLGADKSVPTSNQEQTQEVLGSERAGKVLGSGRGWTKTSDSSAMRLYLALFLISAIGFSFTLLYEKRKPGKKR